MSEELFNDVITEPESVGVRVMIYGPAKIGKSYFGAQIPNHIFLNLENGLSHLRCTRTPLITSYDDFNERLKALVTKEHPYKTVIIDTIDKLEDIMRKWIAANTGDARIKDIVDIPYGRGYEYLLAETKKFIQRIRMLTAKGINVIFISHDEIKQQVLPTGEVYNYYAPSLFARTGKGDSTLKIYSDEMDIIARCAFRTIVTKEGEGFNKRSVAKGNGDRIMFMERGNPAYVGGSRYDLPGQIPFTWEDFVQALKNAKQVAGTAADIPEEPTEEQQAQAE